MKKVIVKDFNVVDTEVKYRSNSSTLRVRGNFALDSSEVNQLLSGKMEVKVVVSSKESILDDVEKKYLKSFVSPFRKRVRGIVKKDEGDKEFIKIMMIGDICIPLPNFEKNSMYKGMTPEKEYTLRQLGI